MGGVWHFRDFRPGDNASDPDFAKALFSKGSDGVLPRAIVRESVQNSLDARQSVDGTAHVRFRVRTGRNSAPASAAQSFFTGFWEHIHAQNSGLIDPPSKTTSIPFLVVEDFGTTGLIGDVAQWAPFGSERNAFFLFFRALGRSGKEGEDRGRWGVGKFVFPLASAASCWFGYSVTGGGRDGQANGARRAKDPRNGAKELSPRRTLGSKAGWERSCDAGNGSARLGGLSSVVFALAWFRNGPVGCGTLGIRRSLRIIAYPRRGKRILPPDPPR
jgi:hypothetical protein